MTSKREQKQQQQRGEGEEEEHKSDEGLDVKELVQSLPVGAEQEQHTRERQHVRKEPTEADFKRYKDYEGQKWTGVCKWFNVTKGFGFIVPDFAEAKEHGDDVFVHQSSLEMEGFRSLDEGEKVEFLVKLGKRGLETKEVRGLEGKDLRGHHIHPLGKRKEKEIRCYKCGKFGRHKAAKCKNVASGEKICYICRAPNHVAADCPKKEEQSEQKRETQQKKGQGRPAAGPSAEGGGTEAKEQQ